VTVFTAIMLHGKEWMNFHFVIDEERNFSFLVFLFNNGASVQTIHHQ
jgi:hypothetical protein